MPSLPEPTARHVAALLFGVLVVQLLFQFREPLQTTLNPPPAPKPRVHRPSVPLNLQGLAVLDELAAHIAAVEAHRVFAESGLSEIHGTSIRDPIAAKRIRDQIDCWTHHGSWVRQDEKADKGATTSWSARKPFGDRRFNVCDARFMESLDKMAVERPSPSTTDDGHVMGEYDQQNGRWLVREAVKYRWVPDQSICGPVVPTSNKNTSGDTKDSNENTDGNTNTTSPAGTTGLGDERSIYQPFNPANFCEILGNRNLLMAGDISQYQLRDTILSAVGSFFSCISEQDCQQLDPHQICTTSNLTFVRNDAISVPWALGKVDSNNGNGNGNEDYQSGTPIEQPWATDEMLKRYRIVLLNKGLIWKPDDEFLSELVFTMKYVWKFYPGVMILYRATHPISDCATLKEQREDEAIAGDNGESIVPGATIQRPLTAAPNRTNDAVDPQKWLRPTLADVQRQNMMARVIVESAGGIFLDTENMFALRPDGRLGDGDCSRFCTPGPLDVYADLLYNTLRILPRQKRSTKPLTPTEG
ncbi:hypothetical protein BGX34_005596 [Mortierella sp. NVP85]|nr:hypothetical protein BGX34_005596 [Mortierella sp. NVP85]